ncbi:MAG: MMPL family transporter [Leptospirales bacterium]
MLIRFLHFIKEKRFYIFFLSMMLTVLSGFLASRLTIKADLLELLPDHFDSVQSLKKISALTGGLGYMIVVFESDNAEQNIEFLEEYSERAKSDPDILYVNHKNPSEFIQKNGILWLPLEDLKRMRDDLNNRINYYRKKALSLLPEELGPPPPFHTQALLKDLEEKVKTSPYHQSKDGKMLLSVLKPTIDSNNIGLTKNLILRMTTLKDELAVKYPEVTVHFTGMYPMKRSQIKALEADLLIASLFTVIGVSLSLLFFFRSPKAILIVLFPLVTSLVWTLGINYLLIGHVNLISSFFVSVLLGLGIDYSLQVYSRFKEEYLKNQDYIRAIFISFITTGKGTLFGALTTFGVFFVLIFSDFLTFKETGVLASVGILMILLSIVIHLPILVYFTKPSFSYFKNQKTDDHERRFSIRLMSAINRHKLGIIRVSGLLILAGVFILPYNRFQYDFSKIENRNTAPRLMWERLTHAFDYSWRPAVASVNSLDDLDKLRDYLNSDEAAKNPMLNRHVSMLNFFPYPKHDLSLRVRTVHSIRSKLLKSMPSLKPGDRAQVQKYLQYLNPKPTDLENYPRSIKNAFMGKNAEGETVYFCQIYPISTLGNGLNAFEHARWLKALPEKAGIDMTISSDIIILEDILNLVVSEGKIILPIALLIVILLIYILFRSVWKTILVLSPLIVGLYTAAVILGFSNIISPVGISLNYLNVVAIPILLGVGIDFSIHIFHRIEEAFGKKNKPLKNKWKDIVQTAQALGVSAITTIIGFSSLFLASYNGLRSIAWVSVIGIMVILVTSSVLMPAMFFYIREKFPNLGAKQDEREALKKDLHR